LIVVNILIIFAATFGSVFMCWPIHKYWHLNEPGTCGNRAQYIFGVIGVTIATDVLVTITPAWLLHDLQIPLRNKIGVIAFLSLPLAITAIGCYRLHTFIEVFSLPTLSAEDPYNVRNALSNIESNLAVIAACGPTIKWILGRFIPYFDTKRSTNAYTPDLSSHFQYPSSGNKDRNGEIELKTTSGKRKTPWKKRSDDAESEEHIIPNKSGNEIRKTTVMEWEVDDACTRSSQPPSVSREAGLHGAHHRKPEFS
jgi:hypothetical protein